MVNQVALHQENVAFGKFVAALRQEESRWDVVKWTQRLLAERTQLSERTIARIEQGDVVNLLRYLEPLSDAFRLSEQQRVDFYALAGYVYTPRFKRDSRDFLTSLLKKYDYPVSVRTALWDFVAFNQYHAELRGYSEQTLQRLNEGELGPNLLRVLFDPHFADTQYDLEEDRKERDWETVWAWLVSSFKYRVTKRYRVIVHELSQFAPFRRAYTQAKDYQRSPGPGPKRSAIVKVNHPEFGVMEFISLRVPQRYLDEDIHVSVYVPLAASEPAYQRFRSQVRASHEPYFFREMPLDEPEIARSWWDDEDTTL